MANAEIPLQDSQPSQAAQARPRVELMQGLHKVANQGSTAFWTFWKGMTQEEKSALLHGPEDEQVPVGR